MAATLRLGIAGMLLGVLTALASAWGFSLRQVDYHRSYRVVCQHSNEHHVHVFANSGAELVLHRQVGNGLLDDIVSEEAALPHWSTFADKCFCSTPEGRGAEMIAGWPFGALMWTYRNQELLHAIDVLDALNLSNQVTNTLRDFSQFTEIDGPLPLVDPHASHMRLPNTVRDAVDTTESDVTMPSNGITVTVRDKSEMRTVELVSDEWLAEWGFSQLSLTTDVPHYALPLRLRLSGLLANSAILTVVWIIVLTVLPSTCRAAIRQHRRRQGRCDVCGYDVRFDTSGRCSECGHSYAIREP